MKRECGARYRLVDRIAEIKWTRRYAHKQERRVSHRYHSDDSLRARYMQAILRHGLEPRARVCAWLSIDIERADLGGHCRVYVCARTQAVVALRLPTWENLLKLQNVLFARWPLEKRLVVTGFCLVTLCMLTPAMLVDSSSDTMGLTASIR
ncbi:hypothetical protein PLICRDRAFT_251218 [Plicaturopsis crispa FD-325 SS-3]|nr:hypothetical protein PLICRDRAFT_251218 [Plicaturopsis crispa FD-325 SS-3]